MIKFRAGEYIEQVTAGEIPACQWVRLAVDRHLADLENGHERGLHFDESAAKLVIAFFGLLKHSIGEWAGQPLILEPWQQFILWVLFGWKREDGTRRFRTSYLEVARKNGKTTLMAGVGLYLLVGDQEPGAEIYTAATKKDQAKISHSEATRMVKSSQALRKRIRIYKDNLHIPDSASKYEPLGADTKTLDGLNVHGAVVDELHAHPSRLLWDLLDTATGSRRQPLMNAITTAGTDRQSVCFEFHEYTKKVLEGTIEDDAWFGIIYALDLDPDDESAGDSWDDESTWIKANPNLNVSKKLADMRRKAKRAKEIPSAQSTFRRLETNEWTSGESKWLPRHHWDMCGQAVDPDQLAGRQCYGGLDLSSTTDLAAFLLCFPPVKGGDPYAFLCRFFMPADNMPDRIRRDRVPFDAWVRQGLITATPGNVIDYDWIMDQVDRDAQRFDVKEIAFDRWGASRIQTQLMDMGGDDWLVQFGQGFASMSPPMKEMERLILGHGIAHGGHSVLTWCADNVVAKEDPAGNIKPDKSKSIDRIDGIVAAIMALDRALKRTKAKKSIYEERGLRSLD